MFIAENSISEILKILLPKFVKIMVTEFMNSHEEITWELPKSLREKENSHRFIPTQNHLSKNYLKRSIEKQKMIR